MKGNSNACWTKWQPSDLSCIKIRYTVTNSSQPIFSVSRKRSLLHFLQFFIIFSRRQTMCSHLLHMKGLNCTIWLWIYILISICIHSSTVMTNSSSETSLDLIQKLHFIHTAHFWRVNSHWSAFNARSVSHIILQEKWIIQYHAVGEEIPLGVLPCVQFHLQGWEFNV